MVTQGSATNGSNPGAAIGGVAPSLPGQKGCIPYHADGLFDALNKAVNALADGTCPAGYGGVNDVIKANGWDKGIGVNPSVPNPADVLKPFASVLDFLNWVRNALVNRNFWKGVGLLLGGILVVGFGLYVWLGHPGQDMQTVEKAAAAA